MVGYYSETSLHSLRPVPINDIPNDAQLSVKKLVCSPDFPVSTANYAKSIAPLPTIPDQETNVRCNVCDKTYTSQAAFASHARTHTKEAEDPYRCNICSKTFAVPARLTRHYRTHTGEKPFRWVIDLEMQGF